ncbi:hypothetical protein LTR56_003556 [Elasticomyces elasticus]|nr:hypothetical protein LTR22_024552 [Elasticomyces elasticus]KAK3655549.1 hypothetical protein LTR56_003556 [Elasticomyces elasticus]KAK4917429.1 hypothetical protein LTR49_014649 [Elasticomyces elasticus]KAK5738082.1 hypothetical protein LTS12_025711 [Elasticomyces elasticus]
MHSNKLKCTCTETTYGMKASTSPRVDQNRPGNDEVDESTCSKCSVRQKLRDGADETSELAKERPVFPICEYGWEKTWYHRCLDEVDGDQMSWSSRSSSPLPSGTYGLTNDTARAGSEFGALGMSPSSASSTTVSPQEPPRLDLATGDAEAQSEMDDLENLLTSPSSFDSHIDDVIARHQALIQQGKIQLQSSRPNDSGYMAGCRDFQLYSDSDSSVGSDDEYEMSLF